MYTSDWLTVQMRQLERRPEDLTCAAVVLRGSKSKFERCFIERTRKEGYQPGKVVLVKDLANERRVGADVKIAPRYLGPFMVARRKREGAYKLNDLDGTEMAGGIARRRQPPCVRRQHEIFRENREGYLSGSSSENEKFEQGNET